MARESLERGSLVGTSRISGKHNADGLRTQLPGSAIHVCDALAEGRTV